MNVRSIFSMTLENIEKAGGVDPPRREDDIQVTSSQGLRRRLSQNLPKVRRYSKIAAFI